MDVSIAEAKAAIRKQMQKRRADLAPLQKTAWDQRIVESVLAHPWYLNATTVMLYMAMPQEVNLDDLVAAALKAGKQVGLPQVDKQAKRMQALRYMANAPLATGVFGIREPERDAPILNAEEMDLVVMPGLAFSERGERIGYGGGYYDRFLEQRRERTLLLAVGYDWQVFPRLPATPADRRIDGIVTPTRVIAT